MDTVIHDSTLLQALAGKTVIVTGGANGIGLEVVRLCHSYGANVVVADLGGAIAITKPQEAELDKSSRTLFLPCDVAMWTDISNVFSMAVDRFHKIDIVIPCAGIMKTRRFFDFNTDDNGHLQEDARSSVVIDVNLKGTMNGTYLSPKSLRFCNILQLHSSLTQFLYLQL
jgi:NAD(P)-dependent dehydrogenase (short-subunit alcohol dehydrogenase family)